MNERSAEDENRRKILKVGFDLDQVITNSFKNVLKQFNQRFGTQLTLDDIEEYYFLETIEADDPEEMRAFLKTMYSDESNIFDNARPLANSQKFVGQIVASGHRVHFITTRMPYLLDKTVDWLKKYGFPASPQNVHLRELPEVDGIGFKVAKARELGLDVLVEDDSRIASLLNIPVIILDYAWNRDVQAGNVVRVFSWEEVYIAIDNMSKGAF